MFAFMDNGRFRIKDLVIVELVQPLLLTDPKAFVHKSGSQKDEIFYTKTELWEWLANNDYQQIAIFDNGDGVWATPDPEFSQ